MERIDPNGPLCSRRSPSWPTTEVWHHATAFHTDKDRPLRRALPNLALLVKGSLRCAPQRSRPLSETPAAN
jgi:hypothetical protein